ncbi:MAG: 50S ribosomal protein L11 methyltransferase [Syntrophobacteraceae bacterium]
MHSGSGVVENMKAWTRIDITCSPEAAEHLAAEIADAFGTSVEYTNEGIRTYFESTRFPGEETRLKEILRFWTRMHSDEEEPGLLFSEIPDEDWSETWKAHFKPLRVGNRFLVSPTWESVQQTPQDLMIRIDPGRAFGTGHHETTRLCLQWLEGWVDDLPPGSTPGNLLDVGTGSGILAIGAALLGFQQIIGIDNDPEAIEVAVENIELNSLPDRIRVFCTTPQEVDSGFDVVISNIQSLPLIAMSRTLVSKLKTTGRLVLSGILTEQAQDVSAEYEKRGLRLIGSRIDGEWILLAFDRQKEPA